jgi:hypothetical protein
MTTGAVYRVVAAACDSPDLTALHSAGQKGVANGLDEILRLSLACAVSSRDRLPVGLCSEGGLIEDA